MCIRDRSMVRGGPPKRSSWEACGVPVGSARSMVCLSSVSYTHLRPHETPEHLVCRLFPSYLFSLSLSFFYLSVFFFWGTFLLLYSFFCRCFPTVNRLLLWGGR